MSAEQEAAVVAQGRLVAMLLASHQEDQALQMAVLAE
jgi:hypothetical protein